MKERNRNTWGHVAVQLFRTSILTLSFWDENKIRNKFTEAPGDIEQWVSVITRPQLPDFCTPLLYIHHRDPMSIGLIFTLFKRTSSPFFSYVYYHLKVLKWLSSPSSIPSCLCQLAPPPLFFSGLPLASDWVLQLSVKGRAQVSSLGLQHLQE